MRESLKHYYFNSTLRRFCAGHVPISLKHRSGAQPLALCRKRSLLGAEPPKQWHKAHVEAAGQKHIAEFFAAQCLVEEEWVLRRYIFSSVLRKFYNG
jgi:hypothetical protein